MTTTFKSLCKKRWSIILLIAILILAITILILALIPKEPIKIGFAAQLTGTQAELGVQERNGIQLAIESINDAGGINGRKVQLLIEDDCGIPEAAKAADAKLIEQDVVAIIGHATSSQTIAGLDVTNPAKVVMLSPTTSTPTLSGIDDYFFRVYPSFKDSTEAFAQYIFKTEKLPKLSVIFDSDNMAYASAYFTTFKNEYIQLGGEIVGETIFSSSEQPDFSDLLIDLQSYDAQGLLLIASDADAALIAQKTRILGWPIQLFSSAWAQTKTLIQNGGEAIDGMILEQSYILDSHDDAFMAFKNLYITRFGSDPSFGAAFAYDAARVLAKALEKTNGTTEGLRKALSETTDFPGVAGTFSIDEFGDVKRPFFLSIVNGNEYKVLGELTLDKQED